MFQAFMNHICMDMIVEKWLKVYMDDMGIHTKELEGFYSIFGNMG